MIRTVTGILSVTGLFWAVVCAWGLVLPSAGIIALSAAFTERKIDGISASLIVFSIQAQLGYLIWICWFLRTLGISIVISYRTFWIISAIHHLIWFSYFLIGYDEKGFLNAILYPYLVVVTIVSIALALLDRNID